jgi:hypothetical protein
MLEAGLKTPVRVHVTGALHRDTHYFGSSVFFSKDSLTLEATFHSPSSAADLARLYALHRARKSKSQAGRDPILAID